MPRDELRAPPQGLLASPRREQRLEFSDGGLVAHRAKA